MSTQESTEFYFAHDVVGRFDAEAPTASGPYGYVPYEGRGHSQLEQALAQLGTVRCTYLGPSGPVALEITAASGGVLVVASAQRIQGRFAAWHPAAPPLPGDERERQDERFYAALGPERADVPCQRPGCPRGAIEQSVLCRPHHFEMVQGRPCPTESSPPDR